MANSTIEEALSHLHRRKYRAADTERYQGKTIKEITEPKPNTLQISFEDGSSLWIAEDWYGALEILDYPPKIGSLEPITHEDVRAYLQKVAITHKYQALPNGEKHLQHHMATCHYCLAANDPTKAADLTKEIQNEIIKINELAAASAAHPNNKPGN